MVLLLGACDQTLTFRVEGEVTGAEDSMLVLSCSSLDGVQRLDSVRLDKEGTFVLKASVPEGCPEFYTLSVGDKVIHFAVDSTETITIKAALATMEEVYEVEGNESSEKIREITVKQREVQRLLAHIEKNDDLLPGVMLDSVEQVIERYKEEMKRNYIVPNPSSAAAYFAVCQSLSDLRGTFMLFNPFDNRSDVKCYAAVATAWDAAYPDAERTQQLCNMAIKGMEGTAAPRQQVLEVDDEKISETGIIDVTLPDINSRMHSIRDLKGKVVLLDFTVYSAPESAARTRLLRSLYEAYHAQGFEIYQVSLDEDVHFWKFSCEKLPWMCVHETDGTATRLYGVANLPTFFLVNRENEIVLRSDFMEGTLEDNVKRLL